jgi:hypothetical protein
MELERRLAESLHEAAEALRKLGEAGSNERDRESDKDRHCCFESRREILRLGNALLEAVEVVREAARHVCSPECEHDADDECIERDQAATPPMPPYPPYPPSPPYAPYPPYPPYPPVIVIGGGGCGCGCSGGHVAVSSPTAAQSPSTASTSPLYGSAEAVRPQQSQTPASFLSALSPLLSASAGEFPDPSGVLDVEALLDIGESAAALVQRTLPNPSGGHGA